MWSNSLASMIDWYEKQPRLTFFQKERVFVVFEWVCATLHFYGGNYLMEICFHSVSFIKKERFCSLLFTVFQGNGLSGGRTVYGVGRTNFATRWEKLNETFGRPKPLKLSFFSFSFFYRQNGSCRSTSWIWISINDEQRRFPGAETLSGNRKASAESKLVALQHSLVRRHERPRRRRPSVIPSRATSLRQNQNDAFDAHGPLLGTLLPFLVPGFGSNAPRQSTVRRSEKGSIGPDYIFSRMLVRFLRHPRLFGSVVVEGYRAWNIPQRYYYI